MTNWMRRGMFFSAALLAVQLGYAVTHGGGGSYSRIESEVRRELVTLPSYSLFDHFTFRVEGDTVRLMGKVSTPTLKSSAENVVKRIEGVEQVANQIEVLPVSPSDDRLRLALYYAIYGHTALQNLAMRAFPPIHIIVENGHVTLEGLVGRAMEKTIAGAQASSVFGAFSVTNNLRVEEES
jgi:hyperosmotically inducible protein